MVSAFKPLVLKTSERYNHNTIEHQKDSQPFYLPKKKQYVTEDFTHNNTTKKIIKQEPDMLDLVNQNLTKSSGRSLNDHIYSIGKETSYFYYTFVVLQEKLRNSFNFSRDKFSDCSKLQKRNYDKGIEELSQTFAQNFLQARKDQTSNISDDLISRTQMVISNSSKERLEKKVKFREPLVVETNNDQKENENQGLEYVQGEFITGSKISSSALTTPNPVVIPKTSIPQLESNSIKIPDSINIELPRTPSGSKRNGAISLKNLKKLKKSPERHKSQPGPAELIKKIEPSNFLPLSTFRVKNSFNIKHFTDDEEYTYESTTDDPNTLTPYETLIKQVPRAVGKNGKKKPNGLCPYCEVPTFNEFKNSSYLHHLNKQHGIFSNGEFMPDPIDFGLYRSATKDKGIKIFEGHRCPYPDCDVVCRISREGKGSSMKNRFLEYLRHTADVHKRGKKLDIKRKRESKEADKTAALF